MNENQYVNANLDALNLSGHDHRSFVGGMWDEIGKLQFNYMLAKGLKPENSFIDVACGSMRGGRHFLSYLNAGRYYGFDILRGLIDAGLEHEIKPLGLMDKVVADNFSAAPNFTFPETWKKLDNGLALSLFTHLSLNSIAQCLFELRKVMSESAVFYATIFETTENKQVAPQHHLDGIITYMCEDPYHYTRADMDYVAQKTGWTVANIEGFHHPRGQRMVIFKAA